MPLPTSMPRRNSTRKRSRSHLRCSSIRAGASMCGASRCRATRAPATKWCAAKCARWKPRWYDGDKINKSRTRVDRLGYFDEVTVETPAVPGTTDQVDLNVNVKEKPTGNLMLGAGLSSSEGLVFSGSVQQQNLFGSGKHVGCRLQHQQDQQGVFAFLYRSLLHGRWRQPGLRSVHARIPTPRS